jgi:hypothetical protein
MVHHHEKREASRPMRRLLLEGVIHFGRWISFFVFPKSEHGEAPITFLQIAALGEAYPCYRSI